MMLRRQQNIDEVSSPHRSKAQQGVGMIEEAVVELLGAYPAGLGKAEIARMLGLELGDANDRTYFIWLILQGMAARKRVSAVPRGGRKLGNVYVVSQQGGG
jgi:hypothetical protein